MLISREWDGNYAGEAGFQPETINVNSREIVTHGSGI
jgi:hypothetical protein